MLKKPIYYVVVVQDQVSSLCFNYIEANADYAAAKFCANSYYVREILAQDVTYLKGLKIT